jgi:hypothetical protein
MLTGRPVIAVHMRRRLVIGGVRRGSVGLVLRRRAVAHRRAPGRTVPVGLRGSLAWRASKVAYEGVHHVRRGWLVQVEALRRPGPPCDHVLVVGEQLQLLAMLLAENVTEW